MWLGSELLAFWVFCPIFGWDLDLFGWSVELLLLSLNLFSHLKSFVWYFSVIFANRYVSEISNFELVVCKIINWNSVLLNFDYGCHEFCLFVVAGCLLWFSTVGFMFLTLMFGSLCYVCMNAMIWFSWSPTVSYHLVLSSFLVARTPTRMNGKWIMNSMKVKQSPVDLMHKFSAVPDYQILYWKWAFVNVTVSICKFE